ncbi:hypothetical protein N0V86_008117 [Didymella sp. IMI 355093]|nr:hypothetical protein N0V86_008117 [Didymella sp. IMI 355093]
MATTADNDDDEPTRRESHFNEQRASLRSDTSQSSSNAHSRSKHQSWRSQRQSLPRTSEDFDLDPDRPDRESASPAPAIPRDRSEVLASREKEKRRSKRSSVGRDSATSTSKPRTRAPSNGRNIQDLLIAASWDNLDFLSSPPPDLSVPHSTGEYFEKDQSSASNPLQPSASRNIAAPRTPTQASRRPSLFGRSNPSNSPRSQHGITALPTMGEDVPKLSDAERYHKSWPNPKAQRTSRVLTEVYTICFLIFFAIWGTLARLGLQALTFYPGAPVVFSELWANVAGTFVMGFLSEDMRLFREEWGSTGGGADIAQPTDRPAEGHEPLERQRTVDKKGHAKVKKTIPLYIGLTTGFCGSFTSFSSFIRDVFLGLSNDLPAPTYHPTSAPSALLHRDAGYSVMSVLGVIFITVTLCFCSLKAGAHLAASLDRVTPTLPFRFTRRLLDPAFVLLGIGSWIGAIALTCLPPHTQWRGQALFACVFAPLGCLARYYISLFLNTVNPAFPLGTFVCNIFGTAVIGMSYDLQRVSIGGVAGGSVVGCQVLQGIEDGFCGALTTVSTWMLELDTLKRAHAYVYGSSSVVVGVSVLTVIMGSVRWSIGWEAVTCAITPS